MFWDNTTPYHADWSLFMLSQLCGKHIDIDFIGFTGITVQYFDITVVAEQVERLLIHGPCSLHVKVSLARCLTPNCSQWHSHQFVSVNVHCSWWAEGTLYGSLFQPCINEWSCKGWLVSEKAVAKNRKVLYRENLIQLEKHFLLSYCVSGLPLGWFINCETLNVLQHNFTGFSIHFA